MIFNDKPVDAPHLDQLNRYPIAKALAETLANPAVGTPLTMGILGGWGTGKTSLMKLFEVALGETDRGKNDLVLWFDAWAYARQEQSLWRALLLVVISGVRDTANALPETKRKDVLDLASELEESLYRSRTLETSDGLRLNWQGAFPLIADLAFRGATLGLSDAAGVKGSTLFERFRGLFDSSDAKEAAKLVEEKSRERYVAEVKALDQFREQFERLLRVAGIGNRRRLVLLIDDLDRCLSEDAVAAIEAMKIFLEIDGCVFVLGMDPEVVESGIRLRYSEGAELAFKPSEYLDKVIQLPFRIPPATQTDVQAMIGDFAEKDSTGVVKVASDLLSIAAQENPRALKRLINVLTLSMHIAAENPKSGDAKWRRGLAKILVLQLFHRPLYRLVDEGGVELLLQLELQARNVQDAENEDVSKVLSNIREVPKVLKIEPFLSDFEDAVLIDLLHLSNNSAV